MLHSSQASTAVRFVGEILIFQNETTGLRNRHRLEVHLQLADLSDVRLAVRSSPQRYAGLAAWQPGCGPGEPSAGRNIQTWSANATRHDLPCSACGFHRVPGST